MKACALLLAVALGCASSTVRVASTQPDRVGCCCTYGDCRERFTQHECVSEGQFQGWTYTWHAGECGADDVYPAPDYAPRSR